MRVKFNFPTESKIQTACVLLVFALVGIGTISAWWLFLAGALTFDLILSSE